MDGGYFSDRELGAQPRTSEEITGQAWGGIVALVDSLIAKGAFGCDFPEGCPDGGAVCGTSSRNFALAVQAEVPTLGWPLQEHKVPAIPVVCDVLEFCFRHVSMPINRKFHSYLGHYHLAFDVAKGRQEYQDAVNRILARNGLAFELESNGQMRRLGPPVLREVLQTAVFETGDAKLDRLLETARTRFLSPNRSMRHESLEKLWDAWERLKTQEPGRKKTSVAALLDAAAPAPELRQVLESEARELTRIGNDFMIRHSERGKTPVESSLHVDYLFHRLFALIWLCLRARESAPESVDPRMGE